MYIKGTYMYIYHAPRCVVLNACSSLLCVSHNTLCYNKHVSGIALNYSESVRPPRHSHQEHCPRQGRWKRGRAASGHPCALRGVGSPGCSFSFELRRGLLSFPDERPSHPSFLFSPPPPRVYRYSCKEYRYHA